MRFAIVALLLILAPIAAAGPVQQYSWLPAQGKADPEYGPDTPTLTPPVATVVAFANETWAWTAGERTRQIDVPTGWTRVVMEYTQSPEGDPWDRLFVVLIERVEVLRGTTPRTTFTVEKDLTRYASLLPQGGKANLTVDTSAWEIGPQHVWITLRFYDDPTTAGLVEAAHDRAISAYANRGLCKNSVQTAIVQFPDDVSSGGVMEFFATNHGEEEAQFSSRRFDIVVDGQLLTSVHVFPYRYAWVGFYGGNDVQHPVMWWSAFRALDVAGVHTGPGEIPPYRLALDADQLSMLQGATNVEVRAQSVYGCVWITSLSFLLDG